MCFFGAFVPRGCIFIFIVFYRIGVRKDFTSLPFISVNGFSLVMLSSYLRMGWRGDVPGNRLEYASALWNQRCPRYTELIIDLFRKISLRFTGTFDRNWLSYLKECDNRFWWGVLGGLWISKKKEREYVFFFFRKHPWYMQWSNPFPISMQHTPNIREGCEVADQICSSYGSLVIPTAMEGSPEGRVFELKCLMGLVLMGIFRNDILPRSIW